MRSFILRRSGLAAAHVTLRRLVPNIIQPVLVQAGSGMPGGILAEAPLTFLGRGVPPPLRSWGAVLHNGSSRLFDAPHLVLLPGAATMPAVLAFNFLGDGLREILPLSCKAKQR